MSKKRKSSSRPFVASYIHNGVVTHMRHYARINTVIPRAVTHLLDTGHPGDIVEIAHNEFGFQIGTVKVRAGGRIEIKWQLEA